MVEWTSHWTPSLPGDYNFMILLVNWPTVQLNTQQFTPSLQNFETFWNHWCFCRALLIEWFLHLNPTICRLKGFFFSYFSSPPSSCQKTPCSVEKNWFPWHPESVNVDHQHPHNVPLLSVFNCILSFKRVSGHWLYFQGGKKPNRNWDSLKYRPEGISYGQIPSLQEC